MNFGHRPRSANRTFHPATMKIKLDHGEIARAGIDSNKINDEDFIKKFGEKLSFGTRSDIAASQAGAGKFNFCRRSIQ